MAKKKPDFEEKILDVDASMQGTIAFKDPVNLRINGSFEGKLDTRGNLTIGENAKINANISGDRIVLAGKVVGDIVATQSLSIIAPAELRGSIRTPVISIAEGAVVNGQLVMSNSVDVAAPSGEDLNLRDIAQYLEVETSVIEEWASKQKIPARKEGNEWRFRKSEIDRWIQEERVSV